MVSAGMVWSCLPAEYTMCRPEPPPVTPMSVISASPGPFTTQPMIDRVSGVSMCASRSSSVATVRITSNPCLAQDGQEMIFTPRWRMPIDFRMSQPTWTSSSGSADSDTRMVSPIPAQSRLPSPIALFTVPARLPPASVMPMCSGWSQASASCW